MGNWLGVLRMVQNDLMNITSSVVRDRLPMTPELVRRLPFDLAWRYRALPLAEERGRVTVAVADPDDVRARDAIRTALGPDSCVVRGDPLAIDALLAEVWGDVARCRPTLRVCACPESLTDELWSYAETLADLMGGRLSRAIAAGEADALTNDGLSDCDLVVVGNGSHSLIRRVLSLPVAECAAPCGGSPASFGVLAAHQPRLPLERILLVLCGGASDGAAVDWALRLAGPSGAAVTVLAVVPSVQAMYHGLSRMEQSLRSLLSTDTELARQMRQAARRLVEWDVCSTLRLRQGGPEQQICREMVEGDYQLAIIATRPCQWWLRQLKGDPICLLLKWARWPVLFVEPKTE
jgi:nucleotide-binding universal stress UspA family protein